MTEAAFSLCRNPRCHMRMPATDNEHARFCCRGCWESFYLRRCAVCEREIVKRNAAQVICNHPSCKAELQGKRRRFQPFRYHPAGHVRGASETLAAQGVAEEKTAEVSSPALPRCLRYWAWHSYEPVGDRRVWYLCNPQGEPQVSVECSNPRWLDWKKPAGRRAISLAMAALPLDSATASRTRARNVVLL